MTTIAERQTAALREDQARRARLRREVDELAHLGHRARLTGLITVADGIDPTDETRSTGALTGSFVIEVTDDQGDETLYTTLHAGRTDYIHFHSVDMALLHLLALRAGDRSHGTTAGYAARVLGMKDEGDRAH